MINLKLQDENQSNRWLTRIKPRLEILYMYFGYFTRLSMLFTMYEVVKILSVAASIERDAFHTGTNQ
jgi:hypothetical protein